MFENEVIVGYSNPQIEIFYNGSNLKCYYTFTYDNEVDHVDCIYYLLLVDNLDLLKDDVPTCLSLGLTPDVCKTEEEFIDSFKSVYIK